LLIIYFEYKNIHFDDFVKMNVASVFASLPGNIFIPINPPYGLRLGKNNDTVALYKQIASQINALSGLVKKRKNHVLGFILCPSEETWSEFCKSLSGADIDTYHMTQGGLDIRVAQFYI
jgi:23S rRNA G2445 N2-methylase RlmL